MNQQMTVTYEDGTQETAKVKRFDLIQLERRHGKPLALIFGEDTMASVEDMWFLAYCAAKRQNPELPDTFDDWAVTVDDVSGESEDEAEANPLDLTP
jgi:hypothetical protein